MKKRQPSKTPHIKSWPPPAPDRPIGDDPSCKPPKTPYTRSWPLLQKRKRKNNEQGMLQWWWHTKLDSDDRDMFSFMWLLMGAPLLILVVASGGNIVYVTLQILWAVYVLRMAIYAIRFKLTELVDEYQDHIDIPSAQNDDTEDFFFEGHEEVEPGVDWGTDEDYTAISTMGEK